MQTDTKPELLLDYNVTPLPSPLVPGQSGKVKITVEDSPYYCDQIQFSVPCGDDPADIFATPPPKPSLCISNNHWTTGDPKPIHNTEGGPHYYQWTVSNAENNYAVIKTDFTFTGNVNALGGQAQIIIDEDSGTNPGDLEGREGYRSVTKSDKPLFYLRNLLAIDHLSPGFPCGAFKLGYPIEITWEGNGTSYDLYQSGISKAIYSGQDTNYTLEQGITDITTFCCVAHNANGDKLYECLTLTVTNPAITAQTVTSAGQEEVDGDMTTNQATCNTLSLSSNPTVMAAPPPNASNLIDNASAFRLNGDFKVGGDASFTGPLTCDSINTDNLTIQQSLTLNTQQESLFGAPILVTSGIDIGFGIVPAVSDGYAVVTVSGPILPITESAAYGALGIAGVLDWIYTYGGNSGLQYMSETDGYLMLPVPAGSSWMYQGANIIASAPISFISVYWIPVGKAGSEQSVGFKTPPPSGKNIPDDKHPRAHFERYLAAKRKRRSELIASMETMLETTFDAAQKEEMIEQLMKL
ncbi:hypothetical protein HF324_09095 [Chitinophaga oryzae]|uniref:Ig-like domain-containing protein n=1 Tax=Chitinophaga oryzae TaxID=2725414 RepID=A0ABX6LDZ3_9BACT|nr:hypothetical protein [Chitinophaga oryzae]QJB37998.1 hypothetical protein HF324_09095 [Chitinophaga oryzae]